MATKKTKAATKKAVPNLAPGFIASGVFIVVDGNGKLWRFDADAGTCREVHP